MSTRAVAVIGASADRSKFGNKAVRAYAKQGWEVYPVHPQVDEIEGFKTYPAVDQIPARLDRVAVYVPPTVGVKLLPAIAATHPGELFINPGAESMELLEEARRLGLDPILACSIVDIGESPEALG